MIVYSEISANKRKTVLLMAAMFGLIVAVGYAYALYLGEPGFVWIAAGFSVLLSLASYYFSDKVALAISGAKEIKRTDDPELFRTVENLSIAAGLPTPKIYIIPDNALNAFAAGRDPQHAAVAITSGLRARLTKQELEGVMAHELSHIGNYDIRLATILVVLAGVIALLADWMLRVSIYGGRRRENNQGGGIVAVLALVFILLSPIAATLIRLAVSRKREYLADASAVLLTRYPEGLASALEKIAGSREPLKKANKATAHLYISDPLKAHQEQKDRLSWFAGMFQTHPPVQDRIAKLRGMAG